VNYHVHGNGRQTVKQGLEISTKHDKKLEVTEKETKKPEEVIA
jgi:hypothetical protein